MTSGSDPAGYMSGFGNTFASEALEGALPVGRNSPQRCPYGLYAEQLSGTAFTAPRAANRRSWLYRIRPSVLHAVRFRAGRQPHWKTAPHVPTGDPSLGNPTPGMPPLGPMRWDPPPDPEGEVTFIDGIRTMTTAGDANTQTGMGVHMYHATRSMERAYFYNADGELLVVPERGRLAFDTEFGRIEVAPGEIVVVPRGVKFRVEMLEGPARGYVCENYGAALTLPERGPIGANGLANSRDFLTPVAAYEDLEAPCTLTVKWCGGFHVSDIGHSPLDVVAWHGNHAPYKYDLRRFSPVGAILNDHPDPSIFTVLTSPSEVAGTANVDFVIFPERWMVAEDTFRPPWFHLNVMSEFMGLIYGVYDAKPEGFVPGGMSLHNTLLAHGPDREAFLRASFGNLEPAKLAGTLAFMFESRYPQHLTRYAGELPGLQQGYADCWSGLQKHFDPTRKTWGEE